MQKCVKYACFWAESGRKKLNFVDVLCDENHLLKTEQLIEGFKKEKGKDIEIISFELLPEKDKEEQDDSKLIEKYAKLPVDIGNLSTYEFILANNDFDDDNIRFSTRGLETLAEKCEGVAGYIFEDNLSKATPARIYRTWISVNPNKQTKEGMPYLELWARAYSYKSEPHYKGKLIMLQDGDVGLWEYKMMLNTILSVRSVNEWSASL